MFNTLLSEHLTPVHSYLSTRKTYMHTSTTNDLIEYFYQQIPVTQLPTRPAAKFSRTARKLFIKGPIPLGWIQRANHLGGSTGAVALGLWFYAGINKSSRFKIDGKLDRLTGVTRQTRQQALEKLERAGLIKLFSRPGAYPDIEICAQNLSFA